MHRHVSRFSLAYTPFVWLTVVGLLLPLTGCLAATPPTHAAALPRPAHVVIVIEENHSSSDIIGSSSAPYINSLASQGALFTQSFAVTHPSQPNYLALFSGSTQGITDDSCPHTFSTRNLASELLVAGLTFTGYAEDLPSVGSTVCISGAYVRKHNPWINFSQVPSSDNQPFNSFPSRSHYHALPTVSLVIPNLNHDMHDGTIQQGDTWLKNHLDAYAQWAKQHKSLLIVTWDEDDGSQSNQIPTIFVGQSVKVGTSRETINHYTVLRTLEEMYGLTALGKSADASDISDCWS